MTSGTAGPTPVPTSASLEENRALLARIERHFDPLLFSRKGGALPSPLMLYFESSPPRGIDSQVFDQNVRVVGQFTHMSQVWNFFLRLCDCQHVLPNYSNLRLFRKGVRPLWEDEANRAGGKFFIPRKKNRAFASYVRIIVAIVTGQLQLPTDSVGICLHIRSNVSSLQIWSTTQPSKEEEALAIERIAAAMQLSREEKERVTFRAHASSVRYNREFSNAEVPSFYKKVEKRQGGPIAPLFGSSTSSATSTSPTPSASTGRSRSSSTGRSVSVSMSMTTEEGEGEVATARDEEDREHERAGRQVKSWNDADEPGAARPSASLAGRFFGTIHAPATYSKLHSVLLFGVVPLRDADRTLLTTAPDERIAEWSATRKSTALARDLRPTVLAWISATDKAKRAAGIVTPRNTPSPDAGGMLILPPPEGRGRSSTLPAGTPPPDVGNWRARPVDQPRAKTDGLTVDH
jgi:translation initiation factor 4E